MSARTKELPIRPSAPSSARTIELHIVGPAKKKTAAFNALRKLGFEQIADSIPWRLAFPELEDPDVPGACLRGVRKREGLTQEELGSKHRNTSAPHFGDGKREKAHRQEERGPLGQRPGCELQNIKALCSTADTRAPREAGIVAGSIPPARATQPSRRNVP